MTPVRHPLVDALKVVAAQLIVWHHLSAYGPLSDALWAQAPATADWLYDHARKAVQVFLVVGGFLAAGTLVQAVDGRRFLSLVGQRYRRLVPPFLVALALAAGTATVLHRWLSPDLQLASGSVGTWLAHALLLHDVVDVPAIAAGAWYVAIDFQLHALLAGLAWLATRLTRPERRHGMALALLIGLAGASLLHVNRLPEWDPWALYFVGSYGLGVLAAQATRGHRAAWVAAIVAIGVAALAIEWRDRIALSLTVAVLLAAWATQHAPASPIAQPPLLLRLLAAGADRSYALFLTHYPLVLAGNAALARWPDLTAHAWGVAGTGWVAGLVVAWAFARWVEQPLYRRLC
ncbi:acyltransferase family protein [Tepidimonas taiwanensis]|uniref:acyltransferase family protein n=1 Tax=Tepidimonas taiwanensis TaxID=307486 RepID=UPI0005B8BCA4|nr:acyltransferase family protein [Tepidimonas taiwanensis]